MSNTTQVQESKFWTDDDVTDLMGELSHALNMMEPYYAQSNAGAAAYALLARLEAKQNEIGAFHSHILKPASCTICEQTFERSATKKNKLLDANQQWNSAMSHMLTVHGVTEYAEKRAAIIPAKVIYHEFKNRKEYLDGVHVNFLPA